MVPRKVDFSGVEPTYRMCTLAKRELILQTCMKEKETQCSRQGKGREQAGLHGELRSHLASSSL